MPGVQTGIALALTAAAAGQVRAGTSTELAFATLPSLRSTALVTSAATVGLPQSQLDAHASAGLAGGMLALSSVGAAAMLASTRRRAGVACQVDSVVAVRAAPKVLEGTGGPFPGDFWDPAGLTKGKDDETLRYYRAAELKHGRVAMLACLGWFHTAAGWHPVGDAAVRSSISDDPLIAAQQLPGAGWLQVLFTLMCFEWLTAYICTPPKDQPWDVLGVSDLIADEKYPEWKDQKMRELNNGRLAMVGIIGLIAQTAYTGEYFSAIKNICALRMFANDGNPVCEVTLIDNYGGSFNWPMIYPEAPFSMPTSGHGL
mmetsp:Transcript_91776/g.237829  ORF Transcript_91776/g.237829 Transcript_91776/m.237829 type:complete len:315 (+) Transcript_91776:82-1026(+)